MIVAQMTSQPARSVAVDAMKALLPYVGSITCVIVGYILAGWRERNRSKVRQRNVQGILAQEIACNVSMLALYFKEPVDLDEFKTLAFCGADKDQLADDGFRTFQTELANLPPETAKAVQHGYAAQRRLIASASNFAQACLAARENAVKGFYVLPSSDQIKHNGKMAFILMKRALHLMPKGAILMRSSPPPIPGTSSQAKDQASAEGTVAANEDGIAGCEEG